MTPQQGWGVSRPIDTRRNQRSSPATPLFDPEKIIRNEKGKHKLSTTTSHPKIQSKYVPKAKVLKSALKLNQIPVSPKDSIEISNQTWLAYSTVEFEVGTIFLKDKEDDVSSDEVKFISQLSLIQSEISDISEKEGKSEVSSINEESDELGNFTFSERELEKVLEIAPFLDRYILTEEDIKIVLNSLQNHPKYQQFIDSQKEFSHVFPKPFNGFFFFISRKK